MTEQEKFQRYIDLQELITTKGYKWFLRMVDDQVNEERDAFLRCESDQSRLEKQIRLKLFHEIRGWAEEEIMRCRSLEKMKWTSVNTKPAH